MARRAQFAVVLSVATHGACDAAVLDRFKAGRRSFLNSVAGLEVLPAAVTPVTAIITRMRYGPNPQAIVSWLFVELRKKVNPN